MNTTTKEIYCSYLLRIWVESNEEDTWWYSLEDTRTGKRLGFTSLEKFCAYIIRITQQEKCSMNDVQSRDNGEGV